jgi:hypothetical protein
MQLMTQSEHSDTEEGSSMLFRTSPRLSEITEPESKQQRTSADLLLSQKPVLSHKELNSIDFFQNKT